MKHEKGQILTKKFKKEFTKRKSIKRVGI